MKKFIIPLVTGAVVVSIILTGCVPGAAPTAPTAPTAPAEPSTWVGSYTPDWEPATVVRGTVSGLPTGEPRGIYEGLAIKPDGTPHKIVWSTVCMEMAWLTFGCGIAESYIERAGGEFILLDANLDTQKQISDIEDAIVGGDITAVVMCPIEEVPLVSVVERVRDKGVPCFGWGTDMPGPATISTSWTDYVSLGETAGEAFVEYAESIGEPIEVYEVWGMYNREDAMLRHEGFHNIVDEDPLITVIESGDCGWMNTKACDAVIDTFSAHPEWDAIWEMGAMSGGVIEGLRTIDRLYPVGDPNHVFVGGVDGTPEAMKAIEEGIQDFQVSHSPWELADVDIKALFHYCILGHPVARWYMSRPYNITPAMIGSKFQWGNCINMEVDYDELPVLDLSDIIATPYKGMP